VNFARLVLRASAVVFAGIGASFVVAPSSMGSLVGVSLSGVTADNDVRAVYGGLQVGCGAVLWASSLRSEWLRPGLFAQVILFSGLAMGRIVSSGVVGTPGALGLILFAAELVALGAGLTALLHRRP